MWESEGARGWILRMKGSKSVGDMRCNRFKDGSLTEVVTDIVDSDDSGCSALPLPGSRCPLPLSNREMLSDAWPPPPRSPNSLLSLPKPSSNRHLFQLRHLLPKHPIPPQPVLRRKMNVVTHERQRAEGRRGIYEDLEDGVSEFCGFGVEGLIDPGALGEMGDGVAFECAAVPGAGGDAVGEEKVGDRTCGAR